MQNGKCTTKSLTAYEIAEYAAERLQLLPDEHKRFEYPHIYKVGFSPALLKVRDELINEKLVLRDSN